MKNFRNEYWAEPEDRWQTCKEVIKAIIIMVIIWPASMALGFWLIGEIVK